MQAHRAILIAGPTASGKSALAMRLARENGGVVVNADSMQVYSDLSVLTARPAEAETTEVQHRLYGHVDGAEAYSVGRWLRDVGAVLDLCRSEERTAIVVGGTGLYFKALIEGLSPIPPVPDTIRQHWRSEGERRGAADLHAELSRRDPAMGRALASTDLQRIVRALEVLDGTGVSLALWQREPGRPLLRAEETRRLVVTVERAALYARADARFDAMVAGGALDEVARLVTRGLSSDLPVMRALGVAQLRAVIEGRCNLKEAVAAAKVETRHYIKRQLTWLRRNMMSWESVDMV